jgi:hypothetical protein
MTPDFEPIQLDRQHAFQELLAKCPQISSDYSFANLWGWAQEHDLRWAWSDELVWIRQGSPREVFWAPVGPWNRIDWAAQGDWMAGRRFDRVPEALAQLWRNAFGTRIRIKESRGHWDYLYRIEELTALSGNRFHKKKNLLNQFKKKYAFRYEPFGPHMVELAFEMQDDWCTWRDCEAHDALAAENRVIRKVLAKWHRLEVLMGGAILIDGAMVAYTIAEPLSTDTIVIHFEKGDPSYKGVYQAINQQFLAHLTDGFQLVNREQDLDNEGLRKAKESYNPVGYLKKFSAAFPPGG